MAIIETWFEQDLKKAVKVRYLDGNVFSQDNNGNLIGVNVYSNGEPVGIGGTITASVIRADGATIAVSGNSTGNMAYVILPQAAYAVPGVLSVVIKHTDSQTTSTLCAVVANVYQSTTDTIVDPGTIIPSIETLIAEIEAAVASIPADYSDLWASLAPAYSTSATYSPGEYVTYNGGVYRCISNISSPESWSGSHWTKKTDIAKELYAEKGIVNYLISRKDGITDIPIKGTKIIQGTYDDHGDVYASNTRIRVSNFIPVTKNDSILFTEGTNTKQYFIGYFRLDGSYISDGSWKSSGEVANFDNDYLIIIVFRKDASSNITPADYDATTKLLHRSGGVLTNTDIKTANVPGWYLLADDIQYIDKPTGFGAAAFLNVELTGNWVIQLCYDFSTGKMAKRRGYFDGTSFESWYSIGGGNTYNITNNYSFPEYSQTLSVSASPTITTDTNNYLASTGDNTDRTSAILAMLQSTGICRLGPGKFVVNNLQMPDYTSIIGSGDATVVKLGGNSDGFAIKLGSYCTVSDISISGGDTPPTFASTIGGRHGILWQGQDTSGGENPVYSIINNVFINNFSGGGVTCYDTGGGTASCIEMTNCVIRKCWAGINVSYNSEFHKFMNIKCRECYIGCVNNGGNNMFVNCDFSTCEEVAMLMDNSQGQSPNHTHGSCIGCVFNHTRHSGSANSGVGVKMLNCSGNGFIFDACQIFFSQIYLEDSDGIVFSNCNFGYSNCDITIDGGGAVLFIADMFQAKPPISITNNSNVHFTNCYVRSTGATVEP